MILVGIMTEQKVRMKMIEIIEPYTRSGNEWCTCCSKQTKTKRIKFSQDGKQGISIVLCDDCRRELVRCLLEIEGRGDKDAD